MRTESNRTRNQSPSCNALNEVALEYFATGSQRYSLQMQKKLWHVILRQARPVQILKQVLIREHLASTPHDGKADLFTQTLVRNSECDGPVDGRVLRGERLDPRWVDVVTASNDDVLLSPRNS